MPDGAANPTSSAGCAARPQLVCSPLCRPQTATRLDLRRSRRKYVGDMPMPRAMLSKWVVSLAVLAAVSPAAVRGQAVGVGVGGPRPVGIYGGYWPGYFGYYPGAYSSSWSNGFSLYGPPVPTYGSVPGAFGGADQRLNTGNPWYRRDDPFYPMPRGGKPGMLYAVPTAPFRADERLGPQPLPPGLDGVEQAPQPRRQPGPAEGAPATQPAENAAPIQIEVELPDADAELIFDDHPTRQTGKARLFTTPPLPRGQSYTYEVT